MVDKKKAKQKKDSYTDRNEFKPGFYDQKDKPPITPETYYGTASGKTSFESPIVDPDTSMMINRKKGGMTKPKKISENDMTDYPIGEGKEYPGNSDMPRIQGKLPPGFGEPQEIKKGGLIEIGKGKDYIKDLL